MTQGPDWGEDLMDMDEPLEQSAAGRIVFGNPEAATRTRLYADQEPGAGARPAEPYQLTNPYPDPPEPDEEETEEIARAERKYQRSLVIREWLTNIGELAGIALISSGFWWFSPGLGLISAGLGVILLCVLVALRTPSPPSESSEPDE